MKRLRRSAEPRWRLAPNPEQLSCTDYAPRPNWTPRRWAVLGGSGFIGSGIVQRLHESDADVRVIVAPRLSLDPSAADGRVVAALAGSLRETDDLAAELSDVDVVVNAAGLATPDAQATAELYGANALLPAVVAIAGCRAGVGRMLHVSSAAVQGDRAILDSSVDVRPFSPYSHSKALGERSVLTVDEAVARHGVRTDLLVVRATSVQGGGRRTTESLRRFASSPLASVAAPGNYPAIVSSRTGLAEFLLAVGRTKDEVSSILLQPWEGLTVSDVVAVAGGRSPLLLPAPLCRAILRVGKYSGRFVPKLAGASRRLELVWFGQAQEPACVVTVDPDWSSEISMVLRERSTR